MSFSFGMSAFHLRVPPADTDALDFFARVASNAGTISDAQKSAVNALVISAKVKGYWSKINRWNLFTGTNLAACLVPLKVGLGGATETNVSFVAGDYAASTALTGDGSSKYINTGIPITSLTNTDFGMGVWNAQQLSSEALYRNYIGSSYSATGNTNRFYLLGGNASIPVNGQAGMGSAMIDSPALKTPGLKCAETALNNLFAYSNSNPLTPAAWNNLGFNTGTIWVFAGAGVAKFNKNLFGYYVGNRLNQADLSADWATHNTAIGR